MLKPVIVEKTADLPVDLGDIKLHCQIETGDDDKLLEDYIKSVCDYLDGESGVLGRAYIDQTVRQDYSGFQRKLMLPYGPARELVSVTYYDANNQQKAYEGVNLYNGYSGAFVDLGDANLPETYIRPDAVSVTYKAGFATVGELPERYKQIVRLIVAGWDRYRPQIVEGGNSELPFGASELIHNLKRVPL